MSLTVQQSQDTATTNPSDSFAEFDFPAETLQLYRTLGQRGAVATEPATPAVEPDVKPDTTPDTTPVETPNESPEEIPGLVPAPDADPVPDQCPITH